MTQFNRLVKLMVVAVLAFESAACGTIIYPERRNQSAGHIDVGIALLDGFWLLIGIIPGVVAFAVDFSTGAIYMPKYSKAGKQEFKVVRFDPKHTTRKQLEEKISKEIGKPFSFSEDDYRMQQIESKDELAKYFAEIEK